MRVGWPDRKVSAFPLPAGLPHVNLNTAAFDRDGDLWFTGQLGYVGKLTVKTGQVRAGVVPRGRGPYGICATPAGEIWWCSLAGSYIARVDRRTGESVMVEPPTRGQGARRIWSDSRGRLWVAEWNSGQLSMHDPQARTWKEWRLPGQSPQPYAVYVDERDRVWVSDFGGNAVFVFDAGTGEVRALRHAAPERQHPPDPRPTRRSLVARKRHRAHHRHPHGLKRAPLSAVPLAWQAATPWWSAPHGGPGGTRLPIRSRPLTHVKVIAPTFDYSSAAISRRPRGSSGGVRKSFFRSTGDNGTTGSPARRALRTEAPARFAPPGCYSVAPWRRALMRRPKLLRLRARPQQSHPGRIRRDAAA